jgi:ribonuclease-3
VFLDGGYGAARDFALRIFSAELAALDQPKTSRDPKSALQEAVQARGLSAPRYRTVKVEGEQHAHVFTAEVVVDGDVAATGTGPRKSLAEQAAAAEALRAMAKC